MIVRLDETSAVNLHYARKVYADLQTQPDPRVIALLDRETDGGGRITLYSSSDPKKVEEVCDLVLRSWLRGETGIDLRGR